MTTLLDVRDVVVEIRTRRGVARVVDDVSFEVASSVALGLVGESGCGKTTMLRAVLGLLPPNARASGRILFEDTDLLADAEALRRSRGRLISMIFQEPMTALNPLMRAGQQIAEALEVNLGRGHREAWEEAVGLLRTVGIADPERRARAYPHELSGGMRQRVMIAMALACHPRLILCDEPTTALDVTVQDQILSILAKLQRDERAGVVYVTHDLAVVAQLCQEVAVMYAGRVAEVGRVADVFDVPRHPYTLGLLRSVPRFEQTQRRLSSIAGVLPDVFHPPTGCRFHPRCQFAEDDCCSGEFPLIAVADHHTTSCIHSHRCLEAVREEPVMADA